MQINRIKSKSSRITVALTALLTFFANYAKYTKLYKTAVNMNFLCSSYFRFEQNISRQHPLSKDIQPMSAESSLQCVVCLWLPQPSCWLLSGNFTEDPTHQSFIHPFKMSSLV